MEQQDQELQKMEQKDVPTSGAFMDSLKRNFKQIREDRAEAIVEQAELIYKRQVEDFRVELKRLSRERDNMIDLSPAHSTSLVLATDFNAKEYVARDIDLGVQMRELQIKLDIALRQYEHLFGRKI